MIDGVPADSRDRLVGVIDLKNGQAVHAVAGRREQYQPVAFCGGNWNSLANYYLQLGLSRVYVADLDALGGASLQVEALQSIVSLGFRETLIDVGWSGNEPGPVASALSSVISRTESCCWIAATESCASIDAIDSLVKLVGCSSVAVSFDFRSGEFLTQGPSYDEWCEAVREAGIEKAVVLDVAAVGTGHGPATIPLCQRLSTALPDLRVFSGGGIRHWNDVNELLRAGCDAALVATALYPADANR